MATRRTPAPPAPAPSLEQPPVPNPCEDCNGDGQVLTAQVVGRLRRRTIEAFALCLTCSGTGTNLD
ncbi:hypothetical protein GCM10023194_40900 [Planotetraspora phitsanulokensis]|uniref:Uncharacterized protein n=1 Tax=Planotetraspora phitsanulokensis TaxID=575192 RepID=A0A8J3UA09_9ACTN|nr:hypothetical protein [Planotetraspora phitsanulokensis]GII40922.1 hypothetical protein Pph01_59250 [Planotetraspora phitsanulokensis]